MRWYRLLTDQGEEITLYQCYACNTLTLENGYGYCEMCTLKDAVAEMRRELLRKVEQNTNRIFDMEWRVAKIGKASY